MYRLIEEKLKNWKEAPNRKPLIIRGARQVGKSYTIADFGKNHFRGKLHTIDFEKRPDWGRVFEENLDPARIVTELEILLNEKISPGKDLVFFDEIQAAPRALMSLRYFHEEMSELHIIAAGSLLEFALKDMSFPVGRVQMLNMTPMNFYEFLLASGKDKAAALLLEPPVALSESIHNMLIAELRKYMYIGGMPECVRSWTTSASMAEVFQIQDDLVETYRQDFSKYAPYADKRNLNNVLSSVAREIGKQIKYTRLSDDFSGVTNKKAFELLNLARVVHKVKAASPGSLPLNASASEQRFKAIMVDTGIFRALNEIPSNIEYTKNNLLSMFNGALAEQFVGQEFLSHGQQHLYYWSRETRSSSAEVDYLITRESMIFPIEIKSGSAGKLKSMHQILNKYQDIKHGYVLSNAPYGELPDLKLIFLPLYYAYQLIED